MTRKKIKAETIEATYDNKFEEAMARRERTESLLDKHLVWNGTKYVAFDDYSEGMDPPPMQRFNEGKPALSYMLELDKASRGVSRVLEYGAKKYARNNYKNGGPMSAKEFLLDSMLRHAMAYMNGEDLDEESGLPHVYHMACSAMFAAYHYKGEGAEE